MRPSLAFSFRSCVSLACLGALTLGGCAEAPPAASSAYMVRSISSGRGGTNGEAPVRIRLTTAGNVSEADLSSITSYVRIVARREATRRQRTVAEQRARTAVARMAPAQRACTRYLAVDTDRSAPTFETQAATLVGNEPAESGGTLRAIGPAPKFDRSVMLWDTQSQSLVGNAVYDIASAPPLGKAVRFESYVAQYVGAGR